MSMTLPAPVTAYPLPDGGFAATPEEYAAKMVAAEAAETAKAFVNAHADEYQKGQATRAIGTVTKFLQWQAGVVFKAQQDQIQAAAAQAA